MHQAGLSDTKSFLYKIVRKNTSPKVILWLDQKLHELSGQDWEKKFSLAFSAAPRFTGKDQLKITKEDLSEAQRIRKGWKPCWTMDQAVRVLFILSIPQQDFQEYKKFLDTIFSTADMGEQITLYLSFPLLPYPEELVKLASEGTRSNMKIIFEAIALNNPFPADYFPEESWNHLVLKALFVESSLNEIYGIDERANATLAKMLSDYAHERWAAGRTVNPLLWRPVGQFLEGPLLKDIQKLSESLDPKEQAAAALVCAQSAHPEAKKIFEKRTDLKDKINKGSLNWENL